MDKGLLLILMMNYILKIVDKLSKEQRSNNMRAVKSKGSKIELRLGKELWRKGFRYRENDKTVFGKSV